MADALAEVPLGFNPEELNCPICQEVISDPFVTTCGHTFCYKCLSTHLATKSSCPSCGPWPFRQKRRR